MSSDRDARVCCAEGIRVFLLAAVLALVTAAGLVQAQVGGGGPIPIPNFVIVDPAFPAGPEVTGGSGTVAAPLTLQFDPASTYLPVSPNSTQVYLYQLVWDFGDGSPTVSVPAAPGTAAAALAPVAHAFSGDNPYHVTLTVLTYVQNPDTTLADGPSAFITRDVRLAPTNFPPIPRIQNTGSDATGILPYTATVTASFSSDADGYIIWAAIDWGDGVSQTITPLPPNVPSQTLTHNYTTPGLYKVTLSVIDNGRIPLTQALAPVPAPNDPQAALAAIKAFQAAIPLATFPAQYSDVTINPAATMNLLDVKFDPILRQDFLFIQVPGSLTVVASNFVVDFENVSKDKLNLVLTSNLGFDNLAAATVSITFGSGATALTLPTFVTKGNGSFKSTGFRFGFDKRKQQIRLNLNRATLAAALGRTSQTIVNGNVDVPFVITINGTPLATTIRYAYNSEAGEKGLGIGGHSYPTGN